MKLLECFIAEPAFPAVTLEKNSRGESVHVCYDVIVRYSDAPGAVRTWRGEVSNRTPGRIFTGTPCKRSVATRAAVTLKRLHDQFGFRVPDLPSFENLVTDDGAGYAVVPIP